MVSGCRILHVRKSGGLVPPVFDATGALTTQMSLTIIAHRHRGSRRRALSAERLTVFSVIKSGISLSVNGIRWMHLQGDRNRQAKERP